MKTISRMKFQLVAKNIPNHQQGRQFLSHLQQRWPLCQAWPTAEGVYSWAPFTWTQNKQPVPLAGLPPWMEAGNILYKEIFSHQARGQLKHQLYVRHSQHLITGAQMDQFCVFQPRGLSTFRVFLLQRWSSASSSFLKNKTKNYFFPHKPLPWIYISPKVTGIHYPLIRHQVSKNLENEAKSRETHLKFPPISKADDENYTLNQHSKKLKSYGVLTQGTILYEKETCQICFYKERNWGKTVSRTDRKFSIMTHGLLLISWSW